MNRADTTERVLVYENDPITGARMTSVFAISTFVFSVFLAGYVFFNMSRGGEPAPFASRIGWSSVLAFGGLAFLGWAWLHNRKVTQRIFYKPRGELLEVENLSLLGTATRDIPLAALENASFHEGDPAGESRVNAPFVRIGVHRGRSFVVNLPGHVHHRDVFSRMLERAGFDAEDALQKQGRVEQHG